MLVALAGRLNRHQQAVIEYLKEESAILKEQLAGKRLKLTDGDRATVCAVKAGDLSVRPLQRYNQC